MTNSLVEDAIFFLNVLSSNNWVSNTIEPAEFFPGRSQLDFNIKIISFGAYAIAYAKTKNDMTLKEVP